MACTPASSCRTVPLPSGRVRALSLSSTKRSSKDFTRPAYRCACGCAAAASRSERDLVLGHAAGTRRSPPRTCSRPASAAMPIVSAVMPPSTCSQTSSPASARRRRRARASAWSRHERLAAEAGLDGHDEHLVELGQQVEVPSAGVPGFRAMPGARADVAQSPGERDRVVRGLGVERDRRARLGVARRPAIGVLDHEVHVERDRRDLLQPLDHRQAEREVRARSGCP